VYSYLSAVETVPAAVHAFAALAIFVADEGQVYMDAAVQAPSELKSSISAAVLDAFAMQAALTNVLTKKKDKDFAVFGNCAKVPVPALLNERCQLGITTSVLCYTLA